MAIVPETQPTYAENESDDCKPCYAMMEANILLEALDALYDDGVIGSWRLQSLAIEALGDMLESQ
jgi:hypothetical protein